tara:strand:- start:627 stop:977 length:351 start_codon:yes stop_codon:yes gene_type:complete
MKINSIKTWYFLIYIILILYMSSQSGSSLNWFPNIWKYDKLVHYFEYLILGFLLINALSVNGLKKTDWIYSLIFLLIFPVIDEFVQYFTPLRIPSFFDVLADVFGGLTGAFIRKYI